MEISDVYIIAGSLLFSALFSGIEIAFISANKLQIELEKTRGGITSRFIAGFYSKPSYFIVSMLIGNTLALSIYSIYAAKILEPILFWNLPYWMNSDTSIFVIQTTIASIIVIFIGEFLPKSIFLIKPLTLLKVLAIPTQLIRWILRPISFLTIVLSKVVLKAFMKADFSDQQPVFGLTDLNQYVNKMTSSKDSEANQVVDAKILNNALQFKNIKVRECMVPRTELTAIEVGSSVTELRDLFVQTGYSKILVYKESIDNIIGYCHSSELFKKPDGIKEILTSLVIVPETLLANELLEQLILEHKSLALVVDEFGGTAGIVTVEDVIEEIFGEIQDEHDDEGLTEKELGEGLYLLSARHEVDYLNDKYGWELPLGEYETLGGLILDLYEDIPVKNKSMQIGSYKLTIESKQNNRIEDVRLEIIVPE